MKLTKNFNLSEFNCKCGCEMPAELKVNVLELAGNLQVLRDYLKVPIHINSAYRCLTHNRAIGSNDSSQHPLAKAGDITADGYLPCDVYETISFLIKNGDMAEGGLGGYKTFTHYDVRGTKARWNG